MTSPAPAARYSSKGVATSAVTAGTTASVASTPEPPRATAPAELPEVHRGVAHPVPDDESGSRGQGFQYGRGSKRGACRNDRERGDHARDAQTNRAGRASPEADRCAERRDPAKTNQTAKPLRR